MIASPATLQTPSTSSRSTARERRRSRPGAVVGAVCALLVVVLGLPVSALAEDPPGNVGGFDPGNIISDATMFAGDRMGAADIDARLRQIGAACSSASTPVPCLKDQVLTTPQRAATSFCAAVPARTAVSIGVVISDVSRACSINPQVIITMLQKEQGLVTTTQPTERKMAQALGYRCPDFQTCDPKYAGLTHQIYHAASRLRQYGAPGQDFTYTVGRHLIGYSPYPFCGQATVDIRNRATAALYNYTPFTPTQTALDAGAGVVADDACAAYGNRNFYRIFAQWFGTPNGASSAARPVAAALGKAPSAPFTDVPVSLMYSTEIAWMTFRGISTGYPDGSFRPTTEISREAMAAFLYRAAGSPAYTAPSTPAFSDVTPSTTIFYTEIMWAREKGIVTGYADGTFRPQATVNRDAMTAFLYRSAGSPAYTPPSSSPFTDVTPQSSIFYREIMWARSQGITTGYPDGTFRDLQPIARDAMSAFLYRQAF